MTCSGASSREDDLDGVAEPAAPFDWRQLHRSRSPLWVETRAKEISG
jgi:hypothetical protein